MTTHDYKWNQRKFKHIVQLNTTNQPTFDKNFGLLLLQHHKLLLLLFGHKFVIWD